MPKKYPHYWRVIIEVKLRKKRALEIADIVTKRSGFAFDIIPDDKIQDDELERGWARE